MKPGQRCRVIFPDRSELNGQTYLVSATATHAVISWRCGDGEQRTVPIECIHQPVKQRTTNRDRA